MQKNILIAIFAVLFITVMAIFVLIFELGDNQESIELSNTQSVSKVSHNTKNKGWTEKLATVNKNSYSFPVNDLFIKIDLKSKKIVTKVYSSFDLTIDNYSRYSLFCIKQVLDSFPLPYILVNEKNRNDIVVQSQNVDDLKPIVEELKKYDIKSKIKEVKYEENSSL